MAHHLDNKAVHQAEVLSNRPISAGKDQPNYLLELKLDRSFTALPGQFIQIQISEPPLTTHRELEHQNGEFQPWTVEAELDHKTPLLNRPFSLADLRTVDGFTQASVLYKVRGPGTIRLSQFRASDNLTLFGPLGSSVFTLPERVDRVVMVGGGLGLAGLLFWTNGLIEKGLPVTMVAGAPTAEQIPLPKKLWSQRTSDTRNLSNVFSRLGPEAVNLYVATDDGTAGHKGFVTEVFDQVLAEKPPSERWAVYACGPWAMLRLIARAADEANVFCQVSLEEMMACGIGACQACVIKVRADNHQGWQYKLCCTQGPVFDARTIVWDQD